MSGGANLDTTNGAITEIAQLRADFLRHNYGIAPNRLLLSHEKTFRLKQDLRNTTFTPLEIQGLQFMGMKIMRTEDGPGVEVAYVWEHK